MRILILFSGNGSLLDLVDRHECTDYWIGLTNNPASPALKKHYHKGLILQPKDINQHLADYGAIYDAILLLGYNKIIPDYLCEKYDGKMVNLHPSLLPKYAGLYKENVIQATLENHDKVAGATLHYVDKDVDKGRIWTQREVIIEPGSTVQTLYDDVKAVERILLGNFLKWKQNVIFS